MNESKRVISRDAGTEGIPCYSSCAPVTLDNGQTYQDPVSTLPRKKKSVAFDLPNRQSFSQRKSSILSVVQRGRGTILRYVELEKVIVQLHYFFHPSMTCVSP